VQQKWQRQNVSIRLASLGGISVEHFNTFSFARWRDMMAQNILFKSKSKHDCW